MNATVVSSTFSRVTALRLIDIWTIGAGVSSLFEYMSSNQNMKSSAVNGSPSLHFMPRRRLTRSVRPPSFSSQPFATFVTTLVQE